MIHDCHGVGQLMTSLLRSAGISGMPNVLHVLENKLPIITARQKEITQVIMYVFGLISNATTMLYDDVQEADFQKYKTMIDGFYEEFRKAIHDGNSMYIFLVKAWDIFQELEFHNYAKNNGILLAQRRKSAENNGAYARKYQDMLRTMS